MTYLQNSAFVNFADDPTGDDGGSGLSDLPDEDMEEKEPLYEEGEEDLGGTTGEESD